MNFLDAPNNFYQTAVAELAELKELRIDLIRNKSLPPEFQSLISLTNLVFSGGHEIKFIKGDTFSCLKNRNITRLSFSGLGIGKIDKDAFYSLPKLTHLDLASTLPGVSRALRATALKVLDLSATGLGDVTHSAMFILEQFCGLNLTEIYLANNEISVMYPIFNKCFPNVRILSLSGNLLDPSPNFVVDIVTLKHLVGLNVSCQYVGDSCFDTAAKSSTSVSKHVRWKRDPHTCLTGMSCPVFFGPSLEWIDLAHNGMIETIPPEMTLMSPMKVRFLKASYCGIQMIKNPLYCRPGVVPTIETFDLSMNSIQCVNASVFHFCNWNALRNLYIGGNRLGETERNICNENKNNILQFLRPLKQIHVLDLSNNELDSSKNLTDIESLQMLTTLDLSRNSFANFTLNLENNTHLVDLDLSHNNIQCLSNYTTLQLSKMKQNKTTLSVTLSGNMLSCTCPCLHFFQWMRITDVLLANNNTYFCKFDDKRVVPLSKLSYIVSKLEYACLKSSWLYYCLAMEISLFLVVGLSSFTYRSRHDLRYIFLKMRQERKRLGDDANFVFSASFLVITEMQNVS